MLKETFRSSVFCFTSDLTNLTDVGYAKLRKKPKSVKSVSSDVKKETTNDTNVTNNSCNSCRSLLKEEVYGWLFVLHELVGLCYAVIELAVAIHINLRLDRLVQALQKHLYGLQEGDIGAG